MTSNQSYQTFTTYDQRFVEIDPAGGLPPIAFARTIWNGNVTCTPETIIGPNAWSTPTQANQLIALFQMYQEWRLKKVICTWHPRYKREDMAGEYMSRNLIAQSTGAPSTYLVNLLSQSLIAKSGSTMTLIEDDTDTTSASTQDELFMVMSHPRSKTYNLMDSFTFDCVPTTMDVQLVPAILNEGQNGAEPFTQNPTAGNMNLALTRPVRLDWQSTRRWVNGNAGNPGLNYDLKGYGFKYYIRAPWNEWDSRTVHLPFRIGFFSTAYTFEFRNQEFRAWTLLPSLAAQSSNIILPEVEFQDNFAKSIERTVNEEPTFKRPLTDEEEKEAEAKKVRFNL